MEESMTQLDLIISTLQFVLHHLTSFSPRHDVTPLSHICQSPLKMEQLRPEDTEILSSFKDIKVNCSLGDKVKKKKKNNKQTWGKIHIGDGKNFKYFSILLALV